MRAWYFFFLSLVVYAQDPFAMKREDLEIKSGPLQGKMLSEERRPVLTISDEERKRLGLPDLGPRVLWVANFSEQKKYLPDRQPFHIAAIP